MQEDNTFLALKVKNGFHAKFPTEVAKRAILVSFLSRKGILIVSAENDELALSLFQGYDENISTYQHVDST